MSTSPPIGRNLHVQLQAKLTSSPAPKRATHSQHRSDGTGADTMNISTRQAPANRSAKTSIRNHILNWIIQFIPFAASRPSITPIKHTSTSESESGEDSSASESTEGQMTCIEEHTNLPTYNAQSENKLVDGIEVESLVVPEPDEGPLPALETWKRYQASAGKRPSSFTSEQKEKLKIYICKQGENKGKLVRLDNNREVLVGAEKPHQGRYLMDTEGQMYLVPMDGDWLKNHGLPGNAYMSFNHGEILDGEDMLCAGDMKVTNGELKKISRQSGNYHPAEESFILMLQYLKREGLEIQNTHIDPTIKT